MEMGRGPTSTFLLRLLMQTSVLPYFASFATIPNATARITGMMKPMVVFLPFMVVAVLSITLVVLRRLFLSRKMASLSAQLLSVAGATKKL